MALRFLHREAHLRVGRSRFSLGNMSYPLNIVVFEDKKTWGFCDGPFFTLGFNKTLSYRANDGALGKIVRHELAHLLTHIRYPEASPHGLEFRRICRECGWGPSVMRAHSDMAGDNEAFTHLSHDKLLGKIKKLLSLASSANAHEAQAATVRANELLLRHNLSLGMEQEDEGEVCQMRVLKASRASAKFHCIASILRTFLVYPVHNHARGIAYLEVTGPRANVTLADYVAHFLDRELDCLWEVHRRKHPHLRGIRSKNSFMEGIAQGYIQKITRAQDQADTGGKLVVLRDKLRHQAQMAYGGLRSSSVPRWVDPSSLHLGRDAGRSLSIKKGLEGPIGRDEGGDGWKLIK